MSQHEPLILIVNAKDEPIGVAPRRKAQKDGLYHRISRVMVEDPDGNILLQKRAADSGVYPDYWDCSAAGHIDEGEDYLDAAKREMFEEIGLGNVDLEELGYYQTESTYDWRQLKRFNKLYRVVVPSNTEFVVDPSEVSEVRWFSRSDVKKLLANPDVKTTDWLSYVFEHFYK